MKALSSSLSRQSFKVVVEPKIPSEGTHLKPDIICWKRDKGYVIDPIICGDNIDLNIRAAEKKVMYGHDRR